jgi:hypothetical protein
MASKRKDSSGRSGVALAALAFAATAPGCYMAQRVYEIARIGRVDPSLVLLSSHVDFLWRCAIASWFGGICGLFVALVLTRRAELSRWLVAMVLTGAALVLLLAVRFP